METSTEPHSARFRNLIGEARPNAPQDPTAQEAWGVRWHTVPLRVGWLEPQDTSPAAVFLASDTAALVTGADYEVTGGDSAKDV